MRIRARYQLTTTLLIIAAVGSTAALIINNQEKVLRSRALQRLNVLMGGAAQVAKESLVNHDRLMVVDYLRALQNGHPELAFASISRAGRVVKIGEESGGLLYLESSVLPAGKPVRYTVSAYPSPSGAGTGDLKVSTGGITLSVSGKATVNIESPPAGQGVSVRLGFLKTFIDREVQSALEPLMRWTAGIAGGFTLLGFIISGWSSKLLTGPVEALTRATAMLAAGRMDVRLPEGADDELGALTASFSSMAGQLKELAGSREGLLDTSGNKTHPQAGVQLVKIEAIFAEALAMLAPMASARYLKVFPLHRINTGRITAREELIRQLVVNLVSGVMKYTPDHGEIRMDLCDTPGELMFYVSNTGRGIPPEDIPHLFSSGGRIPEAGPALQGAHRAVAELGGRIAVETPPGELTLFLVRLPKNHRQNT